MSEKLVNFRYDEDRYESLKDIARRERKQLKVILNEIIDDYVKNHTDGNDTYCITDFVDDSFLATPAYHRPISIWENYLLKCNDESYKEWVRQLEAFIMLERKVTRLR